MNFYRTAGACALALTAVVLSATTTLAASLPENFESYNTDEELQDEFKSPIDTNTEIALDNMGGVGGSKAFLFTAIDARNTAQAELLLDNSVNLQGIDEVTFQFKPLENTATARFSVELKDEDGDLLTTNIPVFTLGLAGPPTNSFTTYTINTSNANGDLSNIAFFLKDNGSSSDRSASLLIDNITTDPVVPEPASVALFAMASAGMIGFRRRSRS